MSRSLQYELTAGISGRRKNSSASEFFRRPEILSPDVVPGPKTAFRLLILFLLVMYSNIAVLYKPLNALRPALVVAVAAICMMVIELGQSRRAFRFIAPQGLLLLSFLGVALISSFDALWPRLAFERTLEIFKILLIYVVIENTVVSEGRLRAIMLTMVVGGLLPALGTINNYMHGAVSYGRAAWIGVFANPNELAYCLVLLFPLAFVLAAKSPWWMRLALFATVGIYLVAIYLTYSRGGLLGLFAVLGLAGWKQKSLVIRALMIAGLIGALLFVGFYWNRQEGFSDLSSDTTYNQRIATIKAGIRMFEANPLFGVGPGCSIVAYPLYVPPEAHCGCELQLVIHNSFIQALSEVGILGSVPFFLFLGFSLLHAWRLQKGPLSTYGAALEVALWGFMVCSLSGGFSYSWWPYILIALVSAARHISSKPQESPNAATV